MSDLAFKRTKDAQENRKKLLKVKRCDKFDEMKKSNNKIFLERTHREKEFRKEQDEEAKENQTTLE